MKTAALQAVGADASRNTHHSCFDEDTAKTGSRFGRATVRGVLAGR